MLLFRNNLWFGSLPVNPAKIETLTHSFLWKLIVFADPCFSFETYQICKLKMSGRKRGRSRGESEGNSLNAETDVSSHSAAVKRVPFMFYHWISISSLITSWTCSLLWGWILTLLFVLLVFERNSQRGAIR